MINNIKKNLHNDFLVDDDLVVVGCGPSSIMFAYNYCLDNPTKKVVILEKNKYTLDDYKNSGFDNIFKYNEAQNSPDYQYSFKSSDNKLVWLGKGCGGGTLHFGLQYIDEENLVNKFVEGIDTNENEKNKWKQYFKSVAKITQAQNYSYDLDNNLSEKSQSIENNSYLELYNAINNNNTMDVYNNKVYSNDLNNDKRLLLCDLLKKFIDNNQLKIMHNISIKKAIFDKNNKSVLYLECFSGNKYKGSKYILGSGSLHTCSILQRSGIGPKDLLDKLKIPVIKDLPVGKTLSDHAGILGLLYYKNQTQSRNIEEVEYTLNIEFMQNIYQAFPDDNKKLLYIVDGINVPSQYKNSVVFDFTKWAKSHPGRENAIKKWATSEYKNSHKMIYPHNKARFTLYFLQNKFPNIGSLGDTITLKDVKSLLNLSVDEHNLVLDYFQKNLDASKNNDNSPNPLTPIDLKFDNKKIISHLQSRSLDLTSQTYFSNLPNLKQYLIVTHALANDINDKGSVEIENVSDSNPNVKLNYLKDFSEKTYNYLNNAFINNDKLLNKLGYSLISNVTRKDNSLDLKEDYLYNTIDSIYHYQGSCKNVVDENQKVNGIENLFICDLSIIPNSWSGSTSVPAMICGYRLAEKISEIEKHEKKDNITLKFAKELLTTLKSFYKSLTEN